jgi:penicillin amidase
VSAQGAVATAKAPRGPRGRLPRILAGAAVALVMAAGGGGLLLSERLHASLPQLDGERPLPGLAAAVRIERDTLGVPVVRGRSRLDVARATGFLHAQERFFQMDLLRRRAAGELAELVGKAALPVDRETRCLRLRAVAERATAAMPADERALLDAYTEGVNAGLSALGARPVEYLLLRVAPRPWRPEDSMLCALAMYLTLQGELPGQESALGLMHDLLPAELVDFLAPKGTEWDAPLDGTPLLQPRLPGPEVVDLRRGPPGEEPATPVDVPVAALAPTDGFDQGIVYGSNNWAVAGTRTASGDAILANDMHLGLSVPNTWYRVSLVFPVPAAGQAPGATGQAERRVTGVTLPGAPFVVVGSNGHVAWGFTNSQGDWADLVVLEPVPGKEDEYLTPDGPRKLGHATETIHVAGGTDEPLPVLSTIWGPAVDRDHRGRRRALAWVALRDGGLNAALVEMESVRSVDEALALAPRVGIPAQNLVVADSSGRIGWTIIGRIPRRVGFDGRLPVSWADGRRRWDGWLAPDEYPRVVDPPSGRIATANSRVASGAGLAAIGFGGYDLGARQRQIRDDLLAIDRATEQDMLRVQLDDRAVFLERWQKLLLDLLSAAHTAGNPRRSEARRLVESWGDHAAVSSVGYRIVRSFRARVAEAAFAPLLASCQRADPRFDYLGRRPNQGLRQWEGPLWALVSERPAHLLDPRFESWDDLLLSALDAALAEMTRNGAPLAGRTWGERNTTLIQHPLSRALPALGRFLDMPREPLPGDSNMPRVQHPSAGASERLAVSPGHEDRGYFHMPGGQSGHPLSANYRDGHEAWARGEPTPFLPGPAVHVLTLVPSRAGADRTEREDPR